MGDVEVASSSCSAVAVSCEECRENPWKYKCPGCSIRTCSLPCVKSHKTRTSCSGKRNRTQIVPLSQFSDDQLITDYTFLEDTLRATESARRMRSTHGGCPAGTDRHPGFKMRMLGVLRKAAFRRKVCLFFLPAGMSKRERNQSRFNRRTNSIFWTIELRFHSTDVVITDHNIDEHLNLISIMGKHLQPTPWSTKLKCFYNKSVESLKFFLKKNARDPSSPFLQLNPLVPLGLQTAGITVVEYPVILVYLPTNCPNFPVEILNMTPPTTSEPSPSGGKGSFFKEEEIGDDDTPGGISILDLGEGKVATSLEAQPAVARDTDSLQTVPSASTVAEENVNGQSFDGGFDFEQEIMGDTYSDLLGEMNPDDFLCFDQEFGEDYCNGLLEEGEIPEFD